MSKSSARRSWAKQHAGQPWRPGETTSGWLVALTRPTGATGRPITTYWYGPGHGWGTTSGGLAYPGPRVWPSKAAAEAALRSVFGPPSRWRGYRPVRVADVEPRIPAQP